MVKALTGGWGVSSGHDTMCVGMDINLDVAVGNPVNRGMERKTCEGNQNSQAETSSLLKFYWSYEPRFPTTPRLQPEGGSDQMQSPLLPQALSSCSKG